jgi:hypothetical protein
MNPHPMAFRPMWAAERSYLLPKKLAYLFSLDVDFQLAVGERWYIRARPSDESGSSTHHVLGASTVVTGDGGTHERPETRVLHGDGEIENDVGPAAVSLSGRLTLETRNKALLLIEYTGVLNVPGGVGTFAEGRRLAGSVFVATRQESAQASFRWLVRRQLFGVGRYQMEAGAKADRLLRSTFDLYGAG